MQSLARIFLGALIVIGSHCGIALAQVGPFGWWPFDDREERFVQPPSAHATAEPSPTFDGATHSMVTPAATTDSTTQAPFGTTNGGPITPVGPSSAGVGSAPPATTSNMPPAERPALFASPFPTFAWPEFKMPYFPKPQMPQLPFLPGKTELDETRNTWVETSPDPAKPSPWQAVTTGASRVSESTKSAWRKTVDVLTPGSSNDPRQPPRVAQRDSQPSLWSRMFSPGPPQPEGPQTVTEWMGQERLKP